MRTLADQIIEAAANRKLDPFTRAMTDLAAKQIKASQRFVINSDIHDEVRDLLISKPSTLLEACAWARPPFEQTWIEWPTSPDHPDPINKFRVKPDRIGAMITAVPGSNNQAWTFWTAWCYDTVHSAEQGRGLYGDEVAERMLAMERVGLGISATEMAFDFRSYKGQNPHHAIEKSWIVPIPQSTEQLAAKRDDRYNSIKWALQNAAEQEAINNIVSMLRWRVRQDPISMEQMEFSIAMGNAATVSMLDDVRDEIGPLVGMLIMMNARNAIEHEKYDPPPKLVKARIKHGNKPPPVDYTVVRIKMSRVQANRGGTAAEREAARRHEVRGHFKVRRTGVFWWTPHKRGHGTEVSHDHYEVTP